MLASATSTQIKCPACHAAQSPQASGSYVCDYCLQPFSVVEAKDEDHRLREEIERWLRERVGAGVMSGDNVDASSRAYIFRKTVLPELRRDLDRALETLVVGHHPLVESPVAILLGHAGASNPLVQQRKKILDLKGLRARLSSGQVTSFAVGESDRRLVEEMDEAISGLLHLSNVADAAGRGDERGFSSARLNIETLLIDLGKHLSRAKSAEEGAFLGAQERRFRALAELCRVCEELASPNGVVGEPLAARLTPIAEELDLAAQGIEGSGHRPVESLPLSLAASAERQVCLQLQRWVLAYCASARSGLSFPGFVRELIALFPKGSVERLTELAEAAVRAVVAAKGEVQAAVYDDFEWTQPWAEAGRKKKFLGIFGVEEKLEEVETFLLPVWVADLVFSRAKGTFLTQGVEARGVAIVDACAPTAEGVKFLFEAEGPVAQALSRLRPLPRFPVALPASSAADAKRVIEAASRSRTDLKNPHVQLRELAFVSGAIAHTSSSKGRREIVGAADSIVVDPAARSRVQAFEQLLRPAVDRFVDGSETSLNERRRHGG